MTGKKTHSLLSSKIDWDEQEGPYIKKIFEKIFKDLTANRRKADGAKLIQVSCAAQMRLVNLSCGSDKGS